MLLVPVLVGQAPAEPPAAKPQDPPTQSRGASDEPTEDLKAQEERFERLLAEALKEPDKVDWRPVRAAFAGTTHHNPYDREIVKELEAVHQQAGKVAPQETEAAYLKLIDRERSMRLDSVFLLMRFYDETNQPEKAEAMKRRVDAIMKAIDFPNRPTEMKQAPQVLYIDEEYMFLGRRKLDKQRHVEQGGHHYDILMVKPQGDLPAESYYFNIDLVWRGNPIRKLKR